MTLPRNLHWLGILGMVLFYSVCQAGIGGNIRWKVPIIPVSQIDGTGDVVGEGAQFVDPTETLEPRRFYRVIRLP